MTKNDALDLVDKLMMYDGLRRGVAAWLGACMYGSSHSQAAADGLLRELDLRQVPRSLVGAK